MPRFYNLSYTIGLLLHDEMIVTDVWMAGFLDNALNRRLNGYPTASYII
jgi:hypothetical protein